LLVDLISDFTNYPPPFQKQVFLENLKRSKGALKNQLVVRHRWRRLLEGRSFDAGGCFEWVL